MALAKFNSPPKNKNSLQRDFKTRQISEQGFAVVVLIGILPLIVSAMALLSATYVVMNKKSESLHYCRSLVLAEQWAKSQQLTQLLKLNKKATRLRAKNKKYSLALAAATAAGQLYLVPRLSQVLIRVKAQQALLKAKQIFILNRANNISYESHRRWQSFLRTNKHSHKHHQQVGLAVVAKPIFSLSPSYFPTFNFKEQQKTSFAWEVHLNRHLPRWWGKLISKIGSSYSASCAGSMEKRRNKWSPILAAAKF